MPKTLSGVAVSTIPSSAPAPTAVAFYKSDGYRALDSVGYLMKKTMALMVPVVDARLARHELSHSQWGPLFVLQQGRASTVAGLARELDVDMGAMTRVLDRLENKGLCRRERSTLDRRVVNIEITAAGAEAIAAVPAVLSEVNNSALAGFSREEWLAFKNYLERTHANLQRMTEHEHAGAAANSSLRGKG